MNLMSLILTTLLISPYVSLAEITTLDIDVKNSEVTWQGGKKIGKQIHYGKIKVKKGEVKVDEKGILRGGEIIMDMETIENEDVKSPKYSKKLNNHLKSDDFFDVYNYPIAKLKIKRVLKSKNKKKNKNKSKQEHADKTKNYELIAQMQIKDKKNLIRIPLEVTSLSKTKHMAKGSFTFDRTLWDVKYASDKFFKSLGDKIIKDKIKMSFELQAKLKIKSK